MVISKLLFLFLASFASLFVAVVFIVVVVVFVVAVVVDVVIVVVVFVKRLDQRCKPSYPIQLELTLKQLDSDFQIRVGFAFAKSNVCTP